MRRSPVARDGADVVDEESLGEDTPCELLDADVLWVPDEQPEKRAFLHMHRGELALYARCDDCGATTCTTPELHLYLPCAHCTGEISITWDVALA